MESMIDMSCYTKKHDGLIHIGLIPDGNRRYSEKKGISILESHQLGTQKIEEFLRWSFTHPKIKEVSIWALSLENLKRTEEELNELWGIYNIKFNEILTNPIFKDNQVKVNIIGDWTRWKPHIRDVADSVIKATKRYSQNILNICLAYAGEWDILQAVQKKIKNPLRKFQDLLHVKNPIHLLVRCGGQYRLSNFALFPISQSEIYFEKKLFPEVTIRDYNKWIRWFEFQQKRYGR